MDPNGCTTRLLEQNFGMCISPEDNMILPFYNSHGTNYYRPWKLFTEMNKDFGSTIDNTKDKIKIALDVQHFRPNEISVKVIDREIFIEGKHEEKQDDHGFISRQFTRRYILPKDCQSETVTSTLSSDGVLVVTASKNFDTKINLNERVVPITMSGPCPQMMEESKREQFPKKEQSTVMLETTKEVKDDAKIACSKKDSQMMLKEDHCRLLKSDLLSEAVSGTEKLLSDSRKETEELLKLISSNTSAKATTSAASERLEEVLGECKSAITELTEKASETTMASDSRKETEELLKLVSSNTSAKATTSAASERLEEVLGECKSAITELTEKASEMTMASDSRKETEELLKLISSNTCAKATSSAASERLEKVLGECKSAITDLTEKASETTMASASEVSCSKNSMTSEIFESLETLSSTSKSSMSMQSSMKATHETMREMICSELKETAENV